MGDVDARTKKEGRAETENQSAESSVLYKTATQKADAVSAFVNTARLTGGRATFMAGFAYYSVGRYMSSCCSSSAYIGFNLAALVLSIITAGTCQIFVYYALRLVDTELQYEFCMQAISYNRFLSRTNGCANMLYTIGIGLLPWAYYQDSDMKWCPLVLMIIIALAYYPVMIKVVVSQLKLQDYNINSPAYLNPIDDVSLVKNSPYGDPKRSQSLPDFLLKQSNIVSGRAIFVSGLAQQGIMRFMPSPAEFSSNDHLANMFLVCVSFAMAGSYFAGNIFLLFQVFIPDTVKSKQLPFAILVYPLANVMFFCYISGFVALFLGNIFVADGCDFSSLRQISVTFGVLGLVLVLVCVYVSAPTDTLVEDEVNIARSLSDEVVNVDIASGDANTSTSTATSATAATVDKAKLSGETQLQNILLALNTAGSMSTFAAGYLFYNIITYETDVLSLSANEDVDWLVRFNLMVNFTTVTTALYASVTDTVLSLCANHYATSSAKLRYFQSRMWLVSSVIYGYYASLVGWFVCFGFFGFVKFSRYSYIPFCYSVVGVGVMVLGTLYIHHARKSIDISNPRINAGKILTLEEVTSSISRPANLTSLGFSVIFLGGFAYFAVNFFDFNDRPHELVYLHAMCVCYVTSMWVMVFADRYNYQINKCPNVTTKLAFSEKTYVFYCCTVLCAYVVVVSLLVGFNFLGFIKYITNYEDVRKEIQMSTSIIGLFCLPLTVWVISTFRTAMCAKDAFNCKGSAADIDRFKNQVVAGLTTSGFISGNVCYELLFAEANSKYMWANKFYFFMMSFAFSFGVSAVSVSTLILLCLGELTSRDKKAYFMVTLRRVKLGIFLLSMSCILCWQASILALSSVKYTGEKGGFLQSLIPGGIGLWALLWYYWGVKRISDGIKLNGRTVTAAAVEDDAGDANLDITNDSGSVGESACGDEGATSSRDPSTTLNPLVTGESAVDDSSKPVASAFEVEVGDESPL